LGAFLYDRNYYGENLQRVRYNSESDQTKRGLHYTHSKNKEVRGEVKKAEVPFLMPG